MQWLDWEVRKFVDVWVQTDSDTLCVFTTSSPLFSKLMCKPIAFKRTRGFFEGLENLIDAQVRLSGSSGRNHYFGFLVDVKERGAGSSASSTCSSPPFTPEGHPPLPCGSPSGSAAKTHAASYHPHHPHAEAPSLDDDPLEEYGADAAAQLHVFRVVGRSQHRTWSAVFERIPALTVPRLRRTLHDRVAAAVTHRPDSLSAALPTSVPLPQKLRIIRECSLDDIVLHRTDPATQGKPPVRAGSYHIPSAVAYPNQHSSSTGSASFPPPSAKRADGRVPSSRGKAKPVISRGGAGGARRAQSHSPNHPMHAGDERRPSVRKFGESPNGGVTRRCSLSELRGGGKVSSDLGDMRDLHNSDRNTLCKGTSMDGDAPPSKFFHRSATTRATSPHPSPPDQVAELSEQLAKLTIALQAKEDETKRLHEELDKLRDTQDDPETPQQAQPSGQQAEVAELQDLLEAQRSALLQKEEEAERLHAEIDAAHDRLALSQDTASQLAAATEALEAAEAGRASLESDLAAAQGQLKEAQAQATQQLQEARDKAEELLAKAKVEAEEQLKEAHVRADEQAATLDDMITKHDTEKLRADELHAEKRKNKSEAQLARKQSEIVLREAEDAEKEMAKWKDKYRVLEEELDARVAAAKVDCIEKIKGEVSAKFRAYEMDVSQKSRTIASLEERIKEMEQQRRDEEEKAARVSSSENTQLESYVRTALSPEQQVRLEELDLQLGELLDQASDVAATGSDPSTPGYTISGAKGAYYRKSIKDDSVEQIAMD